MSLHNHRDVHNSKDCTCGTCRCTQRACQRPCPGKNTSATCGSSAVFSTSAVENSMYCNTPNPAKRKALWVPVSVHNRGKHKKHAISFTVHSVDELKLRHHPKGSRQDCRTCRCMITRRRPRSSPPSRPPPPPPHHQRLLNIALMVLPTHSHAQLGPRGIARKAAPTPAKPRGIAWDKTSEQLTEGASCRRSR